MIGGYVRLSRDDDKRNYVSIENQKMMIEEYAASHQMVVGKWYEDDGISGYLFDRPGFGRMMEDLKGELDTVLVKDFSRIGRHNAKVLLLLDEFQQHGKHLIVIDDHYDSFKEEDDSIGIKTWYNERYVKDASKKIRSVITARQKNGTFKALVPFGYVRSANDADEISIVEEEAETIRYVYSLYLSGLGYRRIAEQLNEEMRLTPSMAMHERKLKEGKVSKKRVARLWSEGMVKELLSNDFYMGTYRLHKRTRAVIHGKEERVVKQEQYVFQQHHEAIIEESVFRQVEQEKERRIRNRERNSKKGDNPFSGCLFCKECGGHLIPVVRQSGDSLKTYYICSTYNAKGRKYCAKSHLIKEEELTSALMKYLLLCQALKREDCLEWERPKKRERAREAKSTEAIVNKINIEMQVLIAQKVRDLAANPEQQDMICNAYDNLQAELYEQREKALKKEMNTPDSLNSKMTVTGKKRIEEIIKRGRLMKEDIHGIVDRMTVDEQGTLEVSLKASFKGVSSRKIEEMMNE